ncbi:hypothetical protein ACELLULO517_06540 [Acidisoma cellulosilytica]|uniref:Lipoprotein n=1 Tax=Acidisoma cellulosilyticum TaxID=2802395 RepID=A0A964E2Q8_9PROT|nr:hypothetical protein [Acidisoma cellulosilyticum]MCB8879885.1 hypothetical protein [Acidisoma cellulosilyticum]
MRRNAIVLATLALTGCGYGASRDAHLAQISMIGMSSADLLSCAGPAAKSTKINDVAHVDTYLYNPAATGGFNVTLPLTLGGVSLGGSGTGCIADVRVVHNKVTEVHYTGPNDMTIGSDGVCDPIFRGCLRQPEATMQPVNGTDYDHSSGFHSPAVPPQTSEAEDTETTTTPATTTPKK